MATSTSKVRRVVLDSSVFFAATYSTTGSAYDLLQAAVEGWIDLILTDYVIEETERNIVKRAAHVHAAFIEFRDDLPYLLVEPSESLIADTARVVVAKDAPVIAAARAAAAPFVATYDRRDLLSKRDAILAAFDVTVATPDEILARLDGP